MSSEIFFSFVSEVFGTLAEVSIIDRAKAFLPYRSQFGQFAFGNSVYVSTGHGIQLVVYRQCVTVHDARHSFLRNKTVVSQAEHDVVELPPGEKELSP